MAVAIPLALIVLPLAEIAVFILVGGEIGVWRTVALVFLSALVGLVVLRVQGVMTLLRVRDALNRGETPAAELFHGACLLVGGILLMIPGFITDVVGLVLFLPPARELLRRSVWSSMAGRTEVWTEGRPQGPGPGTRRPGGQGPVIEGEYEEVPNKELPKEDGEPGQREPRR